MSTPFSLDAHGIHVAQVLRNASPPLLYEMALRHERGTAITASGALVALSGAKTGRSPLDKRIVDEPTTTGDIWWGDVNIKLDQHTFHINRERAIDYLNTRPQLYCVDGFAGWDPEHRIKVRVICGRAYHALFMHNMLIRPSEEELASFGTPDYVIFNAGGFPANRYTTGMTSTTSVDISFEEREFVILGTEYAGEMKKGVFTIMNYLMPKRGVLSMHCSATEDRNTQETSILFGLSGTGKTTLSADPKRSLIGDDEHCWTDHGIFNIEGGCYAKVINLSEKAEPDIFRALRFGAVLENVVYGADSRVVSYEDISVTENTRGAYPIEYIDNAKIPCLGGHPRHVIFLTADAFGVLPPVSRLTPAQAMYHFISGYTAKVAGTEVGVSEPKATFSPCFGGPFLVWHPAKYAELLADKPAQAQGADLAGQHRLDRRRLRHRLAHEARLHPRHHRRDPQRPARRGPGRERSPVRPRGADARPRRAAGDPHPAQHLETGGRLRPGGAQARVPVPGELQEVRVRGRRRGARRGSAHLAGTRTTAGRSI